MPDLAVYEHGLAEPAAGVLAVGWLAKEQPFSQGTQSPGFLNKLTRLCADHAVRKTFGHHACPFCGKCPVIEPRDGRDICLGSREIWIPAHGDAEFFAAPDLVLHYCIEHRYLPPASFVEAVDNLDMAIFSKRWLLEALRGVCDVVSDQIEFDLAESVSIEEAMRLMAERKRRASEDSR